MMYEKLNAGEVYIMLVFTYFYLEDTKLNIQNTIHFFFQDEECMFLGMYVCVGVCMYNACVYVWMKVCVMQVCMHVCAYVHMNVWTYVLSSLSNLLSYRKIHNWNSFINLQILFLGQPKICQRPACSFDSRKISGLRRLYVTFYLIDILIGKTPHGKIVNGIK